MHLRYFFAAVLMMIVGVILAQPACGYMIDIDGDSVPEGTLYRDIIWTNTDITAYSSDPFTFGDAFVYSRDVELFDGSLTDLTHDIYLPPMTDSVAASSMPVIYFFYGGGYINGSSKRVRDLCYQYARRGYVCVAPNYRLGVPGAEPDDTLRICDNLLETAKAIYRGMLDAQASMRWMMDSADVHLGIDVDTTNMFVWGPGYFPLISAWQADEMPGFLTALGDLQDIQLKATVGRSANIPVMTKLYDSDDQTPFLIFHGTCDKSVSFSKTNIYDRMECDTLTIPPVTVQNYPIYGSLEITAAATHYYEYYPVCGLHHSHKDIEQQEMREPIAAFLYNMLCDNIAPGTPPLIFPWIVQPCDVNAKCTGADYYAFCDTAVMLGGSCPVDTMLRAPLLELVPEAGDGIAVYPNPATEMVVVAYDAPEEGVVDLRILDLTGSLHYRANWSVFDGLNRREIAIPELPGGLYFVVVDGKAGPPLRVE